MIDSKFDKFLGTNPDLIFWIGLILVVLTPCIAALIIWLLLGSPTQIILIGE